MSREGGGGELGIKLNLSRRHSKAEKTVPLAAAVAGQITGL
jgi:hypothetical protein